ncbi:unnamed protein product [Sphenostylis stenocarpa]|uniref:Uncharacterized protein n=1 Tax=Sphenostylis stenocarpa TaxID=92480 RepID=A0AA86V8M1_9FABA|nr:unnamed protein product [Sphenostylis stenocarpa]
MAGIIAGTAASGVGGGGCGGGGAPRLPHNIGATAPRFNPISTRATPLFKSPHPHYGEPSPQPPTHPATTASRPSSPLTVPRLTHQPKPPFDALQTPPRAYLRETIEGLSPFFGRRDVLIVWLEPRVRWVGNRTLASIVRAVKTAGILVWSTSTRTYRSRHCWAERGMVVCSFPADNCSMWSRRRSGGGGGFGHHNNRHVHGGAAIAAIMAGSAASGGGGGSACAESYILHHTTICFNMIEKHREKNMEELEEGKGLLFQKNFEVPLLLIVNKKAEKVVLAGANEDFMDILCSFLTLPLGTIARLVQQESPQGPLQVGSLNSLYESVVSFETDYLWTETCKEMLLRPRNSSEHQCRSLKINIYDSDPTTYFICPESHACAMNMLSTFKNQPCQCGNIMDHSVSIKNNQVYAGFLRAATTFIMADNLDIIPSTIHEDLKSLGAFFERFLQKLSGSSENKSILFEMVPVNVTKTQVLDLLKCSLLSKTTLTDFFFVNKPLLISSNFIAPPAGWSNNFRIKVKIVARKSNRKILYAEGAEDFAEFLLSFLTLPLGGVVRMLSAISSVGNVDNLFNSIYDLDEEKYFISKEEKYMLVDPNVAPQFLSSICKQLLPICEQASHYYCEYQSIALTGRTSPLQFRLNEDQEYEDYDNKENYQKMKLVDPKSSSGRLFKVHASLPALFMVTDDLVVTRASLTSGQMLVNRLKIPLRDVEEKEVAIGIQEAYSILKASLTSKAALTDGLSHLLANIYAENAFVTPCNSSVNAFRPLRIMNEFSGTEK